MNIALLGFGDKDLDRVLAWIMFALVGAAACGVIYLLGRHQHACRQARKRAKDHPRRGA